MVQWIDHRRVQDIFIPWKTNQKPDKPSNYTYEKQSRHDYRDTRYHFRNSYFLRESLLYSTDRSRSTNDTWLQLLRRSHYWTWITPCVTVHFFSCSTSLQKEMYMAFNVSKWYLLFQNETLLNSTLAKLLRRVLKMAAYNDSSSFVVLINVKDSLKDATRSTKWNSVQDHQMSTFHPRAKTMLISFDFYWFRLEQREKSSSNNWNATKHLFWRKSITPVASLA